jgi:hypothetical protein
VKKSISLGVMVLAFTLTSASSAYAYIDLRETTRGVTDDASKTVKSTVEGTTKLVRNTVDDGTDKLSERMVSQKDQVEHRRAELQEKLEMKAQNRREMLEGKRLAKCESKQAEINRLLDASTQAGNRHLENLQRLEEKVSAFASKKSIASEAYTPALSVANEKEAATIAALDVMENQQFDCSSVDGSNPAGGVKEIRDAKHNSLKEYRDSIIELIRVVKQEFVAQLQAEEARE